MDIRPDGVMKSEKEIREVLKRFNRYRLFFASIPLAIVLIFGAVDFVGIIWWNKRPSELIVAFVKKYWLIILIVAFIIMDIFERSKFNWKHFESLWIPLNKVAIPYKKAEEDIIYGIQRERMRWVKRGVERLEGLNEYLSEMPEYNELLEKGRNWLKENERK